MITVKLLDSSASGGTRNVEVSVGTTVSQLISAHTSANPESCMVRVNRATADLETIITDGDRVTVTPTNIKGA